jgi:hypothetical protein
MVNTSVGRVRAAAWAAAFAIAMPMAVPAMQAAQDAKSPEMVKQLTQVLDEKKLDSIAAADPASPGTFVAALYFQGSQLLVVSAKYAAPALLNDKIAKKDYREAYIDLSSASVAGSKLFVMDSNADGLSAKPGNDQPFDTVERGTSQYAFDGDWKKAKLAEADYMKAFGEIDDAYAHALSVLIAQAKAGS